MTAYGWHWGEWSVAWTLVAPGLLVGLAACAWAGAPRVQGGGVRFGITADCHLLGRATPANEARLKAYVKAMAAWKPDFVVDLGDFACQAGAGPKDYSSTPALHDAQLAGLAHHWGVLASLPCPAYIAMGNHCVGWIKGGDEKTTAQDLCARGHAGEDITKDEFLAVTRMPHRYYSFDVKGVHVIVLDGNNAADSTAPPRGHDGVRGGYFIDGTQKAWLARDLAASREKLKVVFCHEELHHTPPEGSGEGGDVPFPPVGKEGSYVDNGWQIREMLARDGRVAACFSGHKHRNRWVVYGGVSYITLAALHWGGSYAKVTISDKLSIEGVGRQRCHAIPLPKAFRTHK